MSRFVVRRGAPDSSLVHPARGEFGHWPPSESAPVRDDPFPDRSMEHDDKIAWMVEMKGWAIEPVPPRPEADPPMPGYAYTIGLESTYDFPEVVLFGLTPVAASGLAE